MLYVAGVLLLFSLSSQTYSGGTEYFFLQKMECTAVLNEVDKELRCVSLRWGATDEEDYDAVAGQELNNRTELNAGVWYAVESSSAIRGLLQIVRSNYGMPPLSRALPCPYHRFLVSRLYRDNLPELESTKS